jgi:benzoate/toluate 1,2-dioxygenase alpha subunit
MPFRVTERPVARSCEVAEGVVMEEVATPFIVDDRETPCFRVHRRTMTDEGVLQSERNLIFDRTWLYVGHTSEIPKRGDFRTRNVAGRPLIFTRDSEGRVRVYFNTCRHRGATLCRTKEGTSRFFQCFYHAWSYDTCGRLVALPDEAAYGDSFDRHALGLAEPPRVDEYRGFVFVSYDSGIEDLETYLAGARVYLDLVCDQSESGMEILPGTHEYSMGANWKLLVENSIDGYHGLPTHQRYIDMLKESGVDLKNRMPAILGGAGLDLGNGHAVAAGAVAPGDAALGAGRDLPTDGARALYNARRTRFHEIYGDEWADRLYTNRNLLIFPNLLIIDLVMGITVRTMDPLSPDYTEVTGWQLAPVDEPAELRAVRMDNFLTFWGPGGLATPDDVEALECCQRGFASVREVEWNDISRGMNTAVPKTTDELQMRAFWRRWNELITGERLPPEAHAVEVAGV